MKNHILLILASISLLYTSCNTTTNNNSLVLDNIKRDTLPFLLTEANNIVFKTVLNDVDTLDLFLDTGGTELVLKHTTIKEKTSLLKDGKNKDYKEENYVPLEDEHFITLGSLIQDSLTIYPTTLLPKEADGHFGWNLFDNKIVEIDYEKSKMIVHDSYENIPSEYAQLKIEYINTLFCVQGKMNVGKQSFTNRFLFDSGFQRAIVLDKDLIAEDKFPDDLPVLKESRLRNAEGTEFINKVVDIDNICFEQVCTEKVPVQLLSTPNPTRFKTHILGNELLKRYNTFLDFQNGYVYLKPNQLMNLPYSDHS